MKNMYLFVLMFSSILSFAQVLVGEETNQFQDGPFDPSFGYSYSQSIYLASEINATGNITEIQWYFSGSTLLTNSQDLTIYLGHTDKAFFNANNDWESIDNLTQVYTGGIDVSAGEGWVTLILDIPFTYNGSSNLIVAVDENMNGADNYADDFYNSSVATGRTISYRSSSVNPDPSAPLDGNSGVDSYVPNIILGGISETCPIPTLGIATAVTTETAILDWTEGASEVQWDVEYGVAGFTPTGMATASAITKPYAISLLTANTPYEFYVRAVCAADDYSAWNGPFSFRTACDVVIDDISENFNTMPDDLVTPYCWNTLVTTTGTDSPYGNVDSDYNTPDNKYYKMSADDEDTVMLISPSSTVLSDGTHRVEFMAKISSNADETPLSVGTMVDPMDETTYLELKSIGLTTDYQLYYVNIPASMHTYFAFKHGANSTNNREIYIDNVVLVSQPTCIEILGIEISNVTDSQVDISLLVDTQQTQTTWEYILKPNVDETYDPTTEISLSSTNSVNNVGITMDSDMNAIQNNTEYRVYARANCDGTESDGSGQSDWVGPFIFRTACGVVDDFSENFDSMPDDLITPYCWNTLLATSEGGDLPTAYVNYSSSASQYVSAPNYYHMSANEGDTLLLVSPESSVISDGTHRVEFYAKASSATYNTPIIVGRMSDPTDATTFVELASFVLTTTSGYSHNYTPYYVNIPYDNTGLNYIAFKHGANSTYNQTIYLDDVVVTTQPSCYQVLDVVAENIGATSFDLNITVDAQTQVEWQYVVKQTELNFNPSLETPMSTVSLSTNVIADSNGNPIIANSPYRIFVRANCDAVGSEGAGVSEWFGPYDFTTSCAAYTVDDLSYPMMFEATNNEEIVPCWTSLVSEGSGYVRHSTIRYYDGNASARIFYPNSTSTSAYLMLISPQFTDLGNGDKQITFWVQDYNNATLAVGTMSDPTDATTFTEIQRFNNGVDDDFETPGTDMVDDIPTSTANSPDGFVELTVDFSSYTGSDEYIALRVIRSSVSTSFYIDGFTYETMTAMSIHDLESNSEYSFYPNPTTGVLNLMGDNLEGLHAEVYSLNGRLLVDEDVKEAKINVSNLAPGIYLLKLKDADGLIITKKFIKE